MRMVTAIIKPQRLGAVRRELASLGARGMSVTNIRGFGQRKGRAELRRGKECASGSVTKAKGRLPIGGSLDVFPVRGVACILGTVLAGIFVSDGLGALGDRGLEEGMTAASQLGIQVAGAAVTVGCAAAATFLLAKAMDVMGALRAGEEEDAPGLGTALREERTCRI